MKRRLSLVMPCLNEADHAVKSIESVYNALVQTKLDSFEIIIVDCNSSDGTPEILKSVGEKFGLKLYTVQEKNTAKALNVGFRHAQYEYFARCDFHSIYPTNYFEELITALEKNPKVGFVGFPVSTIPVSDTKTATAISMALSSRLGVGNSTFRIQSDTIDNAGLIFSDTAPFGCWRAHDHKNIGGFNESLPKNQDDEFCSRFLAHDLKVAIIIGKGMVTYFGRSNFMSLLVMYTNYGLYKPASKAYRLRSFNPRHFVPSIWLLVNIILIAQAPFSIWQAPFLSMGLYALIIQSAAPMRLKLHFLAATFLIHLGYGLGFIVGWLARKSSLRQLSLMNHRR